MGSERYGQECGRRGRPAHGQAEEVPKVTGKGGAPSKVAPHALALPLQTSKEAFLAPPKASTSLSSQGRTLPISGPVQLAMPRTWAGVRAWSHKLNFAMSPTKAWVASNRPPRVSWAKRENKERRKTWDQRRTEAIQPGPYLPKLGSQGSSPTQGSCLPRLQPHSQGSFPPQYHSKVPASSQVSALPVL